MKESRYNVWVDNGPFHYVYNGLSGTTAVVPATQRELITAFLAGDDPAGLDAAVLHSLVVGRMVITDETDEVEVLQERYRRTRRNSDAFHLTIVTSLGCNFDCPYCFEAKHPSLMDEAVQDRLLRVVETRLASVRRLSVLWYGGEPLIGLAGLLRMSDAFRTRTEAAGADYSASILTNGYLLTAEVAEQLSAHGVRSAQVTVDGPAETHDRRRALTSGRGSFATILANVVAVADILAVSVRVNLDADNVGDYGRLLEVLADAGLAGRVTIHPGQIVAADVDPAAPSASYHAGCLGRSEFAAVERDFFRAAASFGFSVPGLPSPVGAPCTAVRDDELVVGSRGELYKCPETVGNPAEVIGNLLTWPRAGDRLLRWLTFEPFDDEECRSCRALPVCMGGCAHHAMNSGLRDSRCSTFRWRYDEQVSALVSRRDR
ncbi:radical SAM protein [Actinoplanes sp. CA-051413]|uniref:radical SAM protein n=1 Tax=Actinoplanes sp. CA-051413 TaxID=3239899 RepID=UPI003D99833A